MLFPKGNQWGRGGRFTTGDMLDPDQGLASLFTANDAQLGVGAWFRAVYDASVVANQSIGAHLFGPKLPDNFTVLRAWYEVLTTFTSAADTATIALGIETDDVAGIVAATAIATVGDIWDAGWQDTIQDGSAATTFANKTAAAKRQFQLDVAVQALTAGKLVLIGYGMITE